MAARPRQPLAQPYSPDLDQEILLLCDHGFSSSLPAATLTDLGFIKRRDVVGGFEWWREDALPTAKARNHELDPGERVGIRPPEC